MGTGRARKEGFVKILWEFMYLTECTFTRHEFLPLNPSDYSWSPWITESILSPEKKKITSVCTFFYTVLWNEHYPILILTFGVYWSHRSFIKGEYFSQSVWCYVSPLKVLLDRQNRNGDSSFLYTKKTLILGCCSSVLKPLIQVQQKYWKSHFWLIKLNSTLRQTKFRLMTVFVYVQVRPLF